LGFRERKLSRLHRNFITRNLVIEPIERLFKRGFLLEENALLLLQQLQAIGDRLLALLIEFGISGDRFDR
jgi:hypothetical protein